jgi:hypothetical protein
MSWWWRSIAARAILACTCPVVTKTAVSRRLVHLTERNDHAAKSEYCAQHCAEG